LAQVIFLSALSPSTLRAMLGKAMRIVTMCTLSFAICGERLKAEEKEEEKTSHPFRQMTSTIRLRSYQAGIVQQALRGGNTIAVLPTGSGKTLIAAELMRQVGPRSLFFVPTILLVEQQAQAVRNWTGANVAEYFGGASEPSEFDILVTTPKAFQMAQARGIKCLQWASIRLVVFDEVHHVLKDHPYRKLALDLRRFIDACNPAPQILGLTASLTYAVGAKQVEAAIARITAELHISVMATASENEMREAGFLGTRAEAEVQTVEVPGVVPIGVVHPSERKPHLMHASFFKRIRSAAATKVSIDVYGIVVAMEVAVASDVPQFQSPLTQTSLKTWGKRAHHFALQTANLMCKSLEHWYEALRVLVTSWEECEDAAITFLRMAGEESLLRQQVWPQTVQRKLEGFWSTAPASFSRLEHLKDVLLYKNEVLVDSGREFRGLLFVQQRVTTHILEYFINSDAELSQVFRPACIYATTSPATPSLSVSPSKSKSNIAAFASGEKNLLIATVVAEEGMDIPSANCVVSFDPMINSVSLVQRRGRARQADSAFVVLSEREDRTAAQLEQVEKQQLEIVRNFQPGAGAVDSAQQQVAQKSRERGAQSVLTGFSGESADALAALNLYIKKTKVDLVEEYVQSDGRWRCTLKYSSVLRSVCSTGAQGDVPGKGAKKDAKKQAAVLLMKALQSEVGRGA